MRPAKGRMLPPPGTVILCCLVAAIGWQFLHQDSLAEPTPLEVQQSPAVSNKAGITNLPELRKLLPDAAFAAITERPLFTETRRPRQPSSMSVQREVAVKPKPDSIEAPSAPPRPPPGIQLKGVMANGGARKALIEHGSGATKWMSEGETIEGWVLRRITSEQIALKRGEMTEIYELYKQ